MAGVRLVRSKGTRFGGARIIRREAIWMKGNVGEGCSSILTEGEVPVVATLYLDSP